MKLKAVKPKPRKSAPAALPKPEPVEAHVSTGFIEAGPATLAVHDDRPEIQRLIGQFEMVTDGLELQVNELFRQLGPVLVERPTASLGFGKSAADTQLGKSILKMMHRVEEAVSKLDDMRARLAV